MDRLVSQYAAKLIHAGLAPEVEGLGPLVCGLDDRLVWNRQAPEVEILDGVFERLNINSLVFLRPREPYRTIIQYLTGKAETAIQPKDCETRTFLHELSVIREFSAQAVTDVLIRRKSVIVTAPDSAGDPAIIAHGTVSPEQGFVAVSSVCFACYVKFFADYLEALREDRASVDDHAVFDAVVSCLDMFQPDPPELIQAPFEDEETVYRAVAQAGRQTVAYGLVDSYFGNVSYRWRNTLYISQTGSSLDALEGCVDPVPLDGSTSAGLTASSELSAHLETVARTGCRAVLHGHPKFAVILSMDCAPEEKAACDAADQCHIKCPRSRSIEDIPIVPGEVGTGPWGLCHTLPPALASHGRAIVYGHGLFAIGQNDFNDAFRTLLEVERMCRRKYFDIVREFRETSGRG